jgi:2-polyprenyl-3-methyl-5-hydroxy-6-metoxy-1,4-benzoquinol methylase
MRNSDSMWEKWGKSDPYYAVITRDQYHAENLSESKEDFFESGRMHVTGALQDLDQRFGAAGRHSVLDFGCGVGRLVVPLAGYFARVDGMDISPSMLKEASVNLADRAIKNVELLQSDDGLTALHEKKYDLVHSHLVLQHIPRERGYVLIDKLLSHVAPNGSFYIQVPVKRIASPISRAAYFVKHRAPFAYMAFNLLEHKPLFTPTMQMNIYDFGTLLPIFKKHGFENVAFRTEIQNVRIGSYVTARFFARKVALAAAAAAATN